MKKYTETKYVLGKKEVWYHLVDEETSLCVMCKTRDYRRMRKFLTEEIKKV
jgi:hypothetical protein